MINEIKDINKGNKMCCNKVINTITNFWGDKEQILCIKEHGHKGVCGRRPDYSVFGIFKDYVANKIKNMATECAGETAHNSPVHNRGSRYNSMRKGKKQEIITQESKKLLKEQKIYKVGVRQDEISTYKNCQEVELDLYEDALNIFSGEIVRCHICGDVDSSRLNYV